MHGIHPGKLIGGRYEILYLLGSGGMGSVYAAHDTHLGRCVALKVLRPDLAANDSFRQRFLREARIAAQINHPNVTCTYDIGDAEAEPYLVQEFLDGQTLDLALPLSPERALQVALDVADALSYIHAQGYVHCDIKPHNIMLVKQDTERAILLDFGIARMQGVDTTTVFATPHYLAPEQSQGALPTAASDLYALGIVLYESVTGNVPFDGPTQHAIIYNHLHAPVPPLELDSPYTPMLEAIIRTLTAKNPQARYPCAAMLRADLLAVLAGGKQLTTTPAKLRLARSRHMVRRWMLGLPLMLLAGGLAIVSSGIPTSSPAPAPARHAQWYIVEAPPAEGSAEHVIAGTLPEATAEPKPTSPLQIGMIPPVVDDTPAQVEPADDSAVAQPNIVQSDGKAPVSKQKSDRFGEPEVLVAAVQPVSQPDRLVEPNAQRAGSKPERYRKSDQLNAPKQANARSGNLNKSGPSSKSDRPSKSDKGKPDKDNAPSKSGKPGR